MFYTLFTAAVTANIGDNLDGFFRISSMGALVSGILSAALLLASLAFILLFAWAALNWIMSEGDKSKIEAARGKLSNAFIGLLLTAAAWAIYLIVIYMLGLPIDAEYAGASEEDPPESCTGYCQCGNGEWAAPGTIAPSDYNTDCVTCTNGSWGAPYYPAGDPLCPSYINCDPCS
jgi:hypothetical protein